MTTTHVDITAVLAELQRCGAALDGPLQADTPLISSGRLDSNGLFTLVLWLEQQLGQPIDLAQVDVAREWETPESILTWLVRRRVVATRTPVDAAHRSTRSPTAHAPIRLPSGLRIDMAVPDDFAALGALLCLLWSTDANLNERRFRWKYLEAPGAGWFVVVVRNAVGTPVAMRGFSAQRWECDGSTHDLWLVDDLVISPGFRGQGLFDAMLAPAIQQLRDHGARLIISTSPMRVARSQWLARGARDIGPLLTVARRSSMARLYDRAAEVLTQTPLLWRAVPRLPRPRSAAESLASVLAARPAGHITVTSEPMADAMAKLVARLPCDGRLRMVRDESFLRWRYADPMRSYAFVYAHAPSGELDGYLVLEQNRSALADPVRAHIADCEACDAATAERLIDWALATGGFSELVTWRDATSPACRQALDALGFEQVDHVQYARGLPTVLALDVSNDGALPAAIGDRLLHEARHWDLRLAYTSYV